MKFNFFKITIPSRIFLHAIAIFCSEFSLTKHVSIWKSNYILVIIIVKPWIWMLQIKSFITLLKEIVANSCPKLHFLRELRILHHFNYLIIPVIDLQRLIIYLSVWTSLQIDIFSDNGLELHFSFVKIFVKWIIQVNCFSTFNHFHCKKFLLKKSWTTYQRKSHCFTLCSIIFFKIN